MRTPYLCYILTKVLLWYKFELDPITRAGVMAYSIFLFFYVLCTTSGGFSFKIFKLRPQGEAGASCEKIDPPKNYELTV
jgi:hypothetical protein